MATSNKQQRLENREPTSSNVINFLSDAPESAFQNLLQRNDYRLESDEDNLNNVLEQFQPIFTEQIRKVVDKQNAVKVTFVVTAEYKNKSREDAQPFTMYLRSSQYLFQNVNSIAEQIPGIYEEIVTRNENVIRSGSNSQIHKVYYLSLLISRFQPLAGLGYQELPLFLKNKTAIINIENRDERCFGYAILSAILDGQCRPRAAVLAPQFAANGLNGIEYPVEPEQVPALEERLNLKINVFSFFDDEGRGRYPLYISKYNGRSRMEIDLLYWAGHFAWIKNFSRFIFDLSPGHSTKHFCKRCFGLFLSDQTFDRHIAICSRPDFESQIYTFPPPGSILKFRNVRFQLKAPFAIYADFECLVQPLKQGASHSRTVPYQAHIPSAVGFYIVPSDSTVYSPRYETYTGKDVVYWFLNRLLEISKELMAILEDERRLVMSVEDWREYNAAKKCSICEKTLVSMVGNEKVRDHDHLTGKYRGAAHAMCNIQLQQSKMVPVFIHNFRGYDSHLITLGIENFKEVKTSVIGQSYEKYLVMRFGKFIIFKDSYQFMAYSLESLAQELLRSGQEKFRYLKKEFATTAEEEFKLLLRKGIFPYEFMDTWEKLDYPTLPAIEEFRNTLKQSDCAVEDYSHAQRVWAAFKCKSMKDYQDLYLKIDVLLLTDIFESFRVFSLVNYRLDPAYFVSSPQLSWEAMMLMTEVELELISDPEVFSLLDRGLRGGVSMVVKRYAKANNPELGAAEYKPDQPLSYIVYLDANNLYGWAMMQSMPCGSFAWLCEEEWERIDWKTLEDDAEFGFVIECDLDYPMQLHDAHQDYPLAPEKKLIQWEYLNEQQLKLFAHYSIPRSSLKVQKLIPHLLPRRNYVVYYQNLRFYLEEGMILKKIHKVLQFRQSRWLAPYIQKNQDLRAAAKSEFEKNQPKLFNNSIYGKTCENQKKRSDIRLTKTKKECKRLVEKPQMKGFKIFTEKLAAVDLLKTIAKIDKPFYVGFAVLELSKLHMYKFHYRYIKRTFGAKAELLFTDTDSLMYLVTGCNPYECFYRDRIQFFDFANYPKTHKYFDAANNKAIGKFKDEAGGEQIDEFAGLRPKMYSLKMAGGEAAKEKHAAKGIQYAVSKKLRHADFLEQLQNPHENRIPNRRIGSHLHRIYSFSVNKRGLCAYDDKRVILEDGISTLPYGHYRITGPIMTIGMIEPERRYRSYSCDIEGTPSTRIEIPRGSQTHVPRTSSAPVEESDSEEDYGEWDIE